MTEEELARETAKTVFYEIDSAVVKGVVYDEVAIEREIRQALKVYGKQERNAARREDADLVRKADGQKLGWLAWTITLDTTLLAKAIEAKIEE